MAKDEARPALRLFVDGAEAAGGAIRIGGSLSLRVRCPRAGWLHLFNAGSSGAVVRLFPDAAFPGAGNAVEAGRDYAMPGELAGPERFPCGAWVENGPLTAETGLRERVVAVWTALPVALSADCLRSRGDASRGGFAAVEEEIVSLRSLPPGSWRAAAVALEVLEAL